MTARCLTSRTGEGLHRAVDPADGEVYLYAMTFLDDAQRVFACFDQPDLKASYALTVDAPEGWRVLSNTRARVEGGRHAFAPTERIATYLMTLAAGPYEGETAWHDGVELGVWCRRSQRPHLEADELLGITRACLDRQQELFGRRYPFGDSYDQVFVPEFNAGAMENPGMVTFSDESVRLPLAHHAGAAPRARGGHRARDGPHVVRRPRDDALVGRPVAQRVVRRDDGRAHGRRGHGVRGGLARLLHAAQGLGLPRRRPADDPPGRGRRRRHPHGAAQLRRHQLRQGRQRAAPAAGGARARGVLRRRARVPDRARLGQHRAGRPADRARAGQRARPAGVGPRLAGDLGDVGAAGARRRAAPGGRRAAPAPGRRGGVRRRRHGAAAGRAGRARRHRRAHRRCPRGWPATCCCPTTATSPSPGCAWTTARSPPPCRPPAGWPTRSPGRSCTPRCGTASATARCRRPRTSARSCAPSARRATRRR